MNNSYSDAKKVYDQYFFNKQYQIIINNSSYNLILSEHDFNSFLNSKKISEYKRKTIAFKGIVKIVNEDMYALKIKNNKLAILCLNDNSPIFVALFLIKNEDIFLIDIDYDAHKGGKSLKKEDYIDILKRIGFAKKVYVKKL